MVLEPQGSLDMTKKLCDEKPTGPLEKKEKNKRVQCLFMPKLTGLVHGLDNTES